MAYIMSLKLYKHGNANAGDVDKAVTPNAVVVDGASIYDNFFYRMLLVVDEFHFASFSRSVNWRLAWRVKHSSGTGIKRPFPQIRCLPVL